LQGLRRGGLVQSKLFRCILAECRQSIPNLFANFAGEREHAFQDFTDRGTVVLRDPPAEAQQRVVENRFVVEDADDVFYRLIVRRLKPEPDNYASEFAPGKGHGYTHTKGNTSGERAWELISESLVERNR
jgi:hypothetical protein